MNKPTAGDMMICQRSMSPNKYIGVGGVVVVVGAAVARASNNFIFDFFICTFSRSTGFGWYVRDYCSIRKHARAMRCLFEIGFGVVHGLLYMTADGPSNCECAIAGNWPSRCVSSFLTE